jgi:nucleotide-binding universal stress UspA family protein
MAHTTRSILAATDLARTPDPVVRAAGELAAAWSDTRLHVLHALDLEHTRYTQRGPDIPELDARVASARRDLAACIRGTLGDGADVASAEVMVSTAHSAIRARADEVAADLIVVGRHRPDRVGTFTGATADRVIRTSNAPCLVISAPLRLPLRRILVPLDLSEPSLEALDMALEWAVRGASSADTEVLVLHVIPRVYDFEDTPIDSAVMGRRLRSAAAAARERVPGSDGVDLREETRWGDRPAGEIVGVADKTAADLVVMATHGYGPLRRFLVGSVAVGVTRSAPCPVLLIPPSRWLGEADG